MKKFHNIPSAHRTVITNTIKDINPEDKMSDTDCRTIVNNTSGGITFARSDISPIETPFDLDKITTPGIYKINSTKIIVPFELGSTIYLLRDKSHPIDKWMKRYTAMRRFSNIDDRIDVILIVLTVDAILYNNDGWFIISKENTDITISADDELLFTDATKALEKMVEMTKDSTDIITEFGNK